MPWVCRFSIVCEIRARLPWEALHQAEGWLVLVPHCGLGSSLRYLHFSWGTGYPHGGSLEYIMSNSWSRQNSSSVTSINFPLAKASSWASSTSMEQERAPCARTLQSYTVKGEIYISNRKLQNVIQSTRSLFLLLLIVIPCSAPLWIIHHK